MARRAEYDRLPGRSQPALVDLYAALLAPVAWRVPGHAARMLHGFAAAEQSSMVDLLAAANLTGSPARSALYLRHALDESRHAGMFAHRSAELRRAGGRAPLGPVVADTEQLFERLGERRFLAFVHLGEARGLAQFQAHVRVCRGRGDARSVALLEAISADEARHERYTRELLVELCGGERAAAAAVRRARLWEAWRLWRRAGRWVSAGVYAALMLVLFVAVAPLALLVRVARPSRRLGAPVSAVLGVSGHYHDAAAALVVDGRVVAAMQEERFSRLKNDPGLPRRAAAACLAEAGLAAGDLARVVFYENPYAKLERVLVSLLRAFPRSFRQFPRALGAQLGDKLWVLDELSEALGVPRAAVTFADHHRSHAASAFYASPFERAAVLTVDGVGEETSTAIWSGDGERLTLVERLCFPHSLGLFYAAMTAYLGFAVNEGEYKVMGLAAFGAPRFMDEVRRLVRLGADGSFELDLAYFAFTTDTEVGFGPRLEGLLGPRREPERPWDLATSEDRRWADVAASLQAVTEEALVALAREARRRTGHDALCLAGGVALNAVANARILREAGFARVFVQPAAGDAGGALGAAYLGALELGDPRPAPMTTAALGAPIRAGEAEALAAALGLPCAPLADPAGELAELLERGKIVAVARGRFEWGPRALGQRSILALPRDEGVRERLNRIIKKREPFRPFAPAVLAGRASELFEGAPNDMTPFMTTVCAAHPDHAGALRAAVHVDGTARVQTVAPGDALAPLLEELGRRGLLPVVLNTSLNGPGEPIAASATDAIAFFLAHPVDALVVGDSLVTRRAA